ncbi:hypothetical protein CsSME_00031364 [Camellia sinensis var. sinensis]
MGDSNRRLCWSSRFMLLFIGDCVCGFIGFKELQFDLQFLLSLATLPPSPSPFATIGSEENQVGKK